MDSMRSLNTSLPSTASPEKRKSPPSEQLFQAFRSAALSVTNLYKAAASEKDQARLTGYREALEDLTAFLDQENLALGADGEGWRVRQWVTERLEGMGPGPGPTSTESDEEGEEDKHRRSSSPVASQKQEQYASPLMATARSPSPARPEFAPSTTTSVEQMSRPVQYDTSMPHSSDFTFRSTPRHPGRDTETDMEETNTPAGITSPTSARRFEVLPRHLRSSARHNGNGPKASTRSAATLGSLGAGAGLKRRLPFGDFFDISSITFGKDFNPGGAKRGRYS